MKGMRAPERGTRFSSPSFYCPGIKAADQEIGTTHRTNFALPGYFVHTHAHIGKCSPPESAGEYALKLCLANPGNLKMFTAHGADHVMVNGERFGSGTVVCADEVRSDWQAASLDALDEADFAYFIGLRPDVLLLGTGRQQRLVPPRLYRALTGAHIAVEFMNTPAACRTYNILVAEGRRVVAAILF